MKDFKKLVKVVTKRGQKNIPLLFFNKDVEAIGKEMELYLRTQSGDFDTDKDASLGIYDAEIPDHRYKMLKSRVKQKLLNHLFFLDYDDERIPETHKQEEECLRLLHFSKVLINEGEFEVSEKLINKACYLAEEAEFTFLKMSALEMLRTIHTENCRPIHFKKTNEEIAELKELHTIEDKAKETYYYYKILLSKSGHSRKKNIDNVETAISDLKKLYHKYGTYQIFENLYKLEMLYFQLNGDFKQMINLTQEVDQLFEAGKINPRRFDDRHNKYMKIYAHMKSRDYSNGLQYAEKFSSDFSKASHSWFSFMEIYFLLAMHTKVYDTATHIITKVILNSFYDKLSDKEKEKWNIYRGYLYFLSPDDMLLKNYNFEQYFMEIPVFRKDYAGFNAAILILQFLNYLKEDKVAYLKKPVEELGKYVNKFCAECFSKRTKAFYKLLSTIVKCGLDIKTIKIKTKYLSTKLKDIDTPGDVYNELEILPYEQLWDITIKYLKINEVKAEL